ncbi:MAG: unsaturated glucuronylhydrolase [Parcubacteria group bacterium Gr01-1014_38]|nr:MAG: unsaturated glucuronylhydrolase [Parcubacteria group bacterium Gr01-1014_38]
MLSRMCRRNSTKIPRFLACTAALALLPLRGAIAAPPLQDALSARIPALFRFAGAQLTRAAQTLRPTQYPITTDSSGKWKTMNASGWTSGFFPGSLWLLYEQSKNPVWKARAQTWQRHLEREKTSRGTHDLGFMLFTSFGNGHRLTGDDRYRRVLLTAAGSLATRYNPVVGAIKSWESKPAEFPVIIDSLMNLELLFWASTHGGQSAWRDLAIQHARRVRRDHVRPDGSTYHVVTYHPATGAVIKKSTAQGKSDESTWSRGQAWGLYGFTVVYRETGDRSFLQTARKLADYFLANLPSDAVPSWDFRATSAREPKDSSAAAIAASGLLELARLELDASRRTRYFSAAERILSLLSSPAYLAKGTPSRALLLHGTYNKNAGDFDTGTIWGDYYFLEALLRYQKYAPVLGQRRSE